MKKIAKAFLLLSAAAALAVSAVSCKNEEKPKEFALGLVAVENINVDFKDSIKRLAEAGLKKVELMNYFGGGQYGMTAEELKAFLDENGIEVLSSNTMGGSVDVEHEEEYLQRWDALLKEHKTLGAKYVVMTANLYWGPIERVEKICQTLNKIGAMAKGYGIQFLYHFHNIEYNTIIGTDILASDYMLAHTDPDLVNFQFDVFWAQMGGIDPVEYMKKYTNRFPCLHFKDYYELSDDSKTFKGGYKPIFDTFYKLCGEDTILDMEPYMTMEQMEEKIKMHASITHAETNNWPTPRPRTGNGGRPPQMNFPQQRNTDSLNRERLRSLEAVIANIKYMQEKPYIK
jgi:sugar phosphate isomerase/epimerase